jgi:site-specific DNA-methyltransferase (adenine-specific)
MYKILQGDNKETLKTIADNSIDAIVTDPPYGISFLGKDWDSKKATETTSKIAQLNHLPSGMKHTNLANDLEFQFWMKDVYQECLRVLKPGGHLLAFSAARTYHHMAMAAQLAGFEIRDQLMWIYASGFPKSQDVGKQIQRKMGVKEKQPHKHNIPRIGGDNNLDAYEKYTNETVCTDPEAQQWSGWGTALKPAHEPIVLARKPIKTSIRENVQTYGTGALNIDATRIASTDLKPGTMGNSDPRNNFKVSGVGNASTDSIPWDPSDKGRFTSNVIGDLGPYQKYFYSPKVSRKERHLGFSDPGAQTRRARDEHGNVLDYAEKKKGASATVLVEQFQLSNNGNNHPTVKPIALMEYLIKLITPPGGTVLDPFNGSGSTGCAATGLGFDYIGCELDPNYVEITKTRIEAWLKPTEPEYPKSTFKDLFD